MARVLIAITLSAAGGVLIVTFRHPLIGFLLVLLGSVILAGDKR
jgi:hypothetical protein